MRISTVAIIGGGTMGSGIAIVIAKSSRKTILIEQDAERAEAAKQRITQEMDKQIARWGMTGSEKKLVLAGLEVEHDLEAVKDADLVITALPDVLELKKTILQRMGAICRPDTIFATNTSVLSVTELASTLPHPEKMLGLHFMNPVLSVKLVEIVRGFKTSDETYNIGKDFVNSLGKQGIGVMETPGFVTTRLILPLINEAMYALLEGVASAEDIDKAMKLGYGMSSGPLELADRIGLDILLTSMTHLFRESGELKFRPCPLLRKLVRAQHLGLKTGEGFFKYDKDTGKRLSDTLL